MAEWGFDVSDVEKIVQPIANILSIARSQGIFIVHTQMLNDPKQNSPSWRAFWKDPPVAVPNTWGAAHITALTPQDGEIIIQKFGYGAFCGTNLDAVLRNAQKQTVVVVGTGPEICAGETIRQAFALGYHVVAVADCLASFSRYGKEMNRLLHFCALYTIANHYGLVVDSTTLCNFWRNVWGAK